MNRAEGRSWVGVLALGCLLAGCGGPRRVFRDAAAVPRVFPDAATRIETPVTDGSRFAELINSGEPRDLPDSDRLQYVNLPLPEAIHLALRHSKVMRDLGGTVLRTPESMPTAFGPAVQETQPQSGVEAALSAFDADLSLSMFGEKNDRRFNNQFLGRRRSVPAGHGFPPSEWPSGR